MCPFPLCPLRFVTASYPMVKIYLCVVVVIQIVLPRPHRHLHLLQRLLVSAVYRGRVIRPPLANTWSSTRTCSTKPTRRRLSGDHCEPNSAPFGLTTYQSWSYQPVRLYTLIHIQCKSTPPPLGLCAFFPFFHKRLIIFNRFFTHLLYVLIR